MKLRMAKYILASFCILAVMLIFLGSSMQSRTFCLGGIIVAFIGTVFWILFGRCPHCGKYLGKGNENYCPMLQFKSWYGDLDIFSVGEYYSCYTDQQKDWEKEVLNLIKLIP